MIAPTRSSFSWSRRNRVSSRGPLQCSLFGVFLGNLQHDPKLNSPRGEPISQDLAGRIIVSELVTDLLNGMYVAFFARFIARPNVGVAFVDL